MQFAINQSIEQLKPTSNLLLEHALRIVLPAHILQPRLLCSTIPANRILPRRGVVEVDVLAVHAELARLVFALLEQSLGVLLDALVVGDAVPRDGQQQREEVAFRASQAERVPAAGSGFGGYGCGHGLEAQAVGHAWHGETLDGAVGDVEDAGHELRAVAVGACDEELAAVGAGRAGELEGEVGEVGDAHCARELGEGGEVLEDGGTGDVGEVIAGVFEVVVGVLEVAGGEPEFGVGEVDVGVDQGGVGIVGGAAGEGFEGGELAVFGVDVVEDEASPEEASRLASFPDYHCRARL